MVDCRCLTERDDDSQPWSRGVDVFFCSSKTRFRAFLQQGFCVPVKSSGEVFHKGFLVVEVFVEDFIEPVPIFGLQFRKELADIVGVLTAPTAKAVGFFRKA